MSYFSVASLAADVGLSLSEKSITAAKVVLTGFVVVFAVLILLIFIIKIYSSIISKLQQTGKNKVNKISKAEKSSSKPIVSKTDAPDAPQLQNSGDSVDGEVIAVISAAVAAMYGSPEKVRIKSVKKSGAARSAWANAGLLDNTRPF